MRNLAFLSAMVLLMVVPALGSNWLINSDFETGDTTGWIIGGPTTIPDWTGPTGITMRLFDAGSPLALSERYKDNTAYPWRWQEVMTSNMASALSPKDGYSAGWAHYGPCDLYDWPAGCQFQYASQYFQIEPGTYMLDASVDMTSWRTSATTTQDQLAFIQVRVDDEAGRYSAGPTGRWDRIWNATTAWSVYLWNNEAGYAGEWVTRSVTGQSFTTTTGLIEVRVGMGRSRDVLLPNYGWSAVDNVSFSVQGVTEFERVTPDPLTPPDPCIPGGKTYEDITNHLMSIAKPAPSGPGNWLTNGNFETGDFSGWTRVDYSYTANWQGPKSTDPQIFSASTPLPRVRTDYFDTSYYSDGYWKWHWVDGGADAPEPSAKDGYSAVWTFMGVRPPSPYTRDTAAWAQVFLVAPGKYKAKASADMNAQNQTYPTATMAQNAFMAVFAGNQCGMGGAGWGAPGFVIRHRAWNNESNGTWIVRSAEDVEFETPNGLIEVRIGSQRGRDTTAPQYCWGAIDNAYLEIYDYRPVAYSIDDAKKYADGVEVSLSNVIVTGLFYGVNPFAPDCLAVETTDRSSGIRVILPQVWTVAKGDAVTIKGTVATVDGERVIQPTTLTVASSGNPVPEAFSVAGIDTGGGDYWYQGAVVNDATASPAKMAVGTNNVGILMKLSGKVTAANDTGGYDGYFYVDDAYGDSVAGFETGIKDGSGNIGIRCRPEYDEGSGTYSVPSVGQYVDVIGVMGVTQISSINARYMWTLDWSTASFNAFNRNHAAQWSLLSLPAQPQFADPAVVFGSPEKIDGRLYRWDAPTQSLAMYDMWSPDLFGAMNSSEGYWLNATTAGTISYTGYTESTSLDRWISAPNGWKLMGNPFTSNTQWVDWTATDGTAMKSIYDASQYGSGWMQSIGYWWNDATQSLSDLGLADDFPQTEELKTWYGYWVKTGKHLGLVAPH